MLKRLFLTLLLVVSLTLPAWAGNEDFTAFTEVDPGSDISVTSSTVTCTNLDTRNTDSYVYKDYGSGHFGACEHLLDIRMTGAVEGYTYWFVWALTNGVDDMAGLDNWISVNMAYSSYKYYISLREDDGGSLYVDHYNSAALNTTYYIKPKHDPDTGTYGTVYCYIYSDSDRTSLTDTLSIALHSSKKTYQYCFVTNTWNSGESGDSTSGTVANLDLQEGAGATFVPQIIMW